MDIHFSNCPFIDLNREQDPSHCFNPKLNLLKFETFLNSNRSNSEKLNDIGNALRQESACKIENKQ